MVYCLTVGNSEFTDFWHGTSQSQMSSKIRDGSMRAQNFAPKIADVQLTTKIGQYSYKERLSRSTTQTLKRARTQTSHFYLRDAMLVRVFAIATCPSVTRRYWQNVMISSPSGSTTILVFWYQFSSQNSKGSPPPSGSLKEGWGGKIQPFSSFTRQYLENGSRYGQSYY